MPKPGLVWLLPGAKIAKWHESGFTLTVKTGRHLTFKETKDNFLKKNFCLKKFVLSMIEFSCGKQIWGKAKNTGRVHLQAGSG